MFYIRSVNDGVIIPNEMKEEIFKPFVRFNEKEDGKLLPERELDWLFRVHWLNCIGKLDDVGK